MPGEPGVWILLFGDLAAFGILFALYPHQRGQQPELFAASQATLNRSLGATNTLVLLASSLLVAMSTGAVRRAESRRLARLLLAGAVVCGVVFFAIKCVEYHETLAFELTRGTNDFYMYYFLLTGIHLAHLVFGLAALFVLVRQLGPRGTTWRSSCTQVQSDSTWIRPGRCACTPSTACCRAKSTSDALISETRRQPPVVVCSTLDRQCRRRAVPNGHLYRTLVRDGGLAKHICLAVIAYRKDCRRRQLAQSDSLTARPIDRHIHDQLLRAFARS